LKSSYLFQGAEEFNPSSFIRMIIAGNRVEEAHEKQYTFLEKIYVILFLYVCTHKRIIQLSEILTINYN